MRLKQIRLNWINSVQVKKIIMLVKYVLNKGNNNITELRAILQRESQNS